MPTRHRDQARRALFREEQRHQYQAAWQERMGYDKRMGKSVSYYSPCKALTVYRRERPELEAVPVYLYTCKTGYPQTAR